MIIGFDLDGTLIDSIPLHRDAFIYAAGMIGLKITAKDFFRAQSTTAEMMIEKIKPSIKESELDIFLEAKRQYMVEHFSMLKPFPDTVKVLSQLHRKAKIIIFSNTGFKDILKYLEQAELNPLFFDLIVGRDLVEHPKPWPDEIFLATKIEHHQINYYVGDSIIDLKAGKSAGVRTIAVCTGFDTKDSLIREKPYKVIATLSDLIPALGL